VGGSPDELPKKLGNAADVLLYLGPTPDVATILRMNWVEQDQELERDPAFRKELDRRRMIQQGP